MAKRARFELAPMIPIFPQRPGEKDCVFYMRTRTCSYGIACKYDHPAWVPAGGIPDWKEATTTPSKPEALPVRSGEPDCSFYIKTGICKFGSKCKFNHPEDKGTNEEVAKSHTSTKHSSSTVTNGDSYGENGSGKPASSYNAKGLPIRPGETECTFYMKTGSCKFGSACRYNHPEKPPSLSTKGTQNQTSVLATLPGAYGNYSIFPGSFPEYAMTLPVSDFGLQSIMQSSMLPQRPGETACAFYMKTGICKFATTCKFHHPLGRKEAAQVDPVKLTLAGYPRREGEQACPFYMKTGTCKYALTCKFDHPPPGEAAAKAIAEAGKSEQLEVGEVYTHY